MPSALHLIARATAYDSNGNPYYYDDGSDYYRPHHHYGYLGFLAFLLLLLLIPLCLANKKRVASGQQPYGGKYMAPQYYKKNKEPGDPFYEGDGTAAGGQTGYYDANGNFVPVANDGTQTGTYGNNNEKYVAAGAGAGAGAGAAAGTHGHHTKTESGDLSNVSGSTYAESNGGRTAPATGPTSQTVGGKQVWNKGSGNQPPAGQQYNNEYYTPPPNPPAPTHAASHTNRM